MPRVSVLMPVYNAEEYLAEAVESILGQTFADFEFIVIDDGSTDGSAAMLREYERRDGRVRLRSRPNTGYVRALNEAMELATAPYVARMDSDDVALPERFARQVAYLDAHPDCVMLGSRVLLIDSEGLPIRDWCHEMSHEEIDRGHLEGGWPVVHPAVMMRREAVERVGGYREKYESVEDVDLFLRLAEVGRVANLPEVLLKYRKHLKSVCQTRSAEQARKKVEIRKETFARRGMAGEPKPVKQDEGFPAAQLHRMWAWWALQSGFVRTARKHAMASLTGDPLSGDSWRLAYCALRGR